MFATVRMSTYAGWRRTARTVSSTMTEPATSSSVSSTQTAAASRSRPRTRSSTTCSTSTSCGPTGLTSASTCGWRTEKSTRHWYAPWRMRNRPLGWRWRPAGRRRCRVPTTRLVRTSTSLWTTQCPRLHQHHQLLDLVRNDWTNKQRYTARCCRVANELTYFTGDKRTSRQTDKQTEGYHRHVKPLLANLGALRNSTEIAGASPRHEACRLN